MTTNSVQNLLGNTIVFLTKNVKFKQKQGKPNTTIIILLYVKENHKDLKSFVESENYLRLIISEFRHFL